MTSTNAQSVISLPRLIARGLLMALLLVAAASFADSHKGQRINTVEVKAEITFIDYDTRELSMVSEGGGFITMTAGKQVRRLKELRVGDTVVATYIAALAGEIREPTEEEKATPYQELDTMAIARKDIPPAAAEMRTIKAVCTIEGMNRVTRTAMIKGPRGNYHVINDIKPERFEGRMLGDTVVITYTEALALEVNPVASMSAD